VEKPTIRRVQEAVKPDRGDVDNGPAIIRSTSFPTHIAKSSDFVAFGIQVAAPAVLWMNILQTVSANAGLTVSRIYSMVG